MGALDGCCVRAVCCDADSLSFPLSLSLSLSLFNDDEKECTAWRAERIQTMNRFDVLDARDEEEKVCKIG